MNIDEVNDLFEKAIKESKLTITVCDGKITSNYVDGVLRSRIGDSNESNVSEAVAVSSLSTRVTCAEGKITAQGEPIKSITNTVTQAGTAITPYHIQKPHMFPDMHAPAFIIQNGVVYIKQSCIKECTLKF